MSRIITGETSGYTIEVLRIIKGVALAFVDNSYTVDIFAINPVRTTEHNGGIICPGGFQDIEGTQGINFEIGPGVLDTCRDGDLACGVNDKIAFIGHILQRLEIQKVGLV